MDKRSKGNVTGIFPPILHLVVRSCCGACAAHGYTEIDFLNANKNQSAIKRTQREVREAIDDDTELSFPVYGRMEQTDYSNEYGFAPLVQSAGAAFIVPEDEPGAAARMVVKTVFDLWPLIITVFISAFFAGIIMWLFVSALLPLFFLRTVPTFVTAHTFCASRDARVSYGWCLLIQGYFCAV